MNWNKYIENHYKIFSPFRVGRDGFKWIVQIQHPDDLAEAEAIARELDKYPVTHDHKSVVVPKPGTMAEKAMCVEDDLPF